MPGSREGADVSASEPPNTGSGAVMYLVKRRGYELALTAVTSSPNGQSWETASLQAHLRRPGESAAIVLNGKELEVFCGDVQDLMQYLRCEWAKQKAVEAAGRQTAVGKERRQPERRGRVRGPRKDERTRTVDHSQRRASSASPQKATPPPEEP
jgi:hypothetical protein